MKNEYPRIASLKTSETFLNETQKLGINIPFDEQIIPAPDGALAKPFILKGGFKIGNRFCIHPMEGWDGTTDGKATEFTLRRWKNFGRSGV